MCRRVLYRALQKETRFCEVMDDRYRCETVVTRRPHEFFASLHQVGRRSESAVVRPTDAVRSFARSFARSFVHHTFEGLHQIGRSKAARHTHSW
mmetsp:Transcript_19800/g.41719  ORF Transcript_19800/g.41719 Transcript_19800/m.41719 type:complete len:94 (+) Transcript_19800:408-689(+)